MTKRKDVMAAAYISLNSIGAARIAKRLLAERMAWRLALGVPQGFKIPEKPMPATLEDLEAELAEVSAELAKVTGARFAAPLGQEAEALGFNMVALRDRRWKLLALKKGRPE